MTRELSAIMGDEMSGNFNPTRLFRFGLCVAIMAGTMGVAASPPILDDLAFMAGQWAGRSGQVEMEESWLAPKGGVMLGLHRDVVPGKAAFFEFLRIEDRDGKVVYIASPKGKGATEFVLVSLEKERAIFENLEHDFPQRIIYWREEDRLTARIEGVVGGKLKSTEWTWAPVR
jgi:hypothetical protein